jgi:hypothetical protein
MASALGHPELGTGPYFADLNRIGDIINHKLYRRENLTAIVGTVSFPGASD